MLRKPFMYQQICKQFDTVSFNTWFIFSSDQHNYETIQVLLILGIKSKKKLKTLLKDLSPNNIKTVLSNFYIKSYILITFIHHENI